MKRGRMFAFEGGDGMGKATQSKLLADSLGAKLFSFPRYETEVGQTIRGSNRGDWGCFDDNRYFGNDDSHPLVENKRIGALTRQALFLLDRCDAAPAIEGYLTSGVDVVCDRYWPSGVIYGADDGLDEQLLIRAHSILPQPDVWILLDGDVEESFRRRPERQDSYERDRMGAERRREAYVGLFHEMQYQGDRRARWFTINALGTVRDVHHRVLDCCRRVFGRDFLKETK